MLPKTELRYSRVYNTILDSSFKRENMLQLKRDFEKFEKIYKKYINELLRLIQKYSDSWQRLYIPIYLVRNAKSSLSDPLTLKYRSNEKYLLVVLAHELLHNNLKGKWKNSKELHKYMEPILNKIITELPINLEKELQEFNKNINEMY